jgi:hypothetical protein
VPFWLAQGSHGRLPTWKLRRSTRSLPRRAGRGAGVEWLTTHDHLGQVAVAGGTRAPVSATVSCSASSTPSSSRLPRRRSWAAFIAPRARRRLPEPARFGVEFALFAAAGLALALSGWVLAGIVLAVVGIGIAALTRVVAKDG